MQIFEAIILAINAALGPALHNGSSGLSALALALGLI